MKTSWFLNKFYISSNVFYFIKSSWKLAKSVKVYIVTWEIEIDLNISCFLILYTIKARFIHKKI